MIKMGLDFNTCMTLMWCYLQNSNVDKYNFQIPYFRGTYMMLFQPILSFRGL